MDMIADMHCDTLSTLRAKRKQGQELRLKDAEGFHVNLEKMRAGGYAVQNFAAFIDMGEGRDSFEDAMELVALFEAEMRKNADWVRPVTTAEEIEANADAGLLSAMLTLEEGGMCKGDVGKLEEFFRRGARMMTLCWNYENDLATPASPISEGEKPQSTRPDPSLPGLKEKGVLIVEAMESLGMIPDVSHLSDAGFYDVCRICRKPFVASHSNARAICNHARNLSDDMLRQLGEHGGVAGLNYFPEFIFETQNFARLTGAPEAETTQSTSTSPDAGKSQPQSGERVPRGESGPSGEDRWDREACLTLLARHARHMANCGGSECVGLGSDFDGFGGACAPEGADKAEDLAWALHREGFRDGEVDGILYGNVMRLYRETLR